MISPYRVVFLLDRAADRSPERIANWFGRRVREPGIIDRGGDILQLEGEIQDLEAGTRRSVSWFVEPFGESVAAPDLADAIKQTWDWPEAGATCLRHAGAYAVEIADSAWLGKRGLLGAAHAIVHGLVESLQGETIPRVDPVAWDDPEHRPGLLALHFVSSERVIEPNFYRSLVEEQGDLLHAGSVNVRLHQVEGGRPNETVMDTMGMEPLGLPDLQVHFIGLDPNEVANILYNYCHYLLREGDVIKDGQAIRGIDGETWPVRRETSLIRPERTVLDLVPGSARAI